MVEICRKSCRAAYTRSKPLVGEMDFNAVVTYADKMAAKDKGMDLKPPNNIVNELMKKKKRPRTTNNVRLPCPYHV